MGQSVLADNWSLQDISDLLVNGVPQSLSAYLKTPPDAPHQEVSIASGIVAFEALFGFLTNIVLRDQIIVDKAYTYAWDDVDVFAPLLAIEKQWGYPAASEQIPRMKRTLEGRR